MSVADVIRRLRENPGSISKKDRLEMRRLLDLDASEVHDLVGANLRLLREENRRIKAQVAGIHGIAGDNETLLGFIHDATLGIVKAKSAREIASVVRRCAREREVADDFLLVGKREIASARQAGSRSGWSGMPAPLVGKGLPPGLGKVLGKRAAGTRSHVGFPVVSGRRTLALALFISREEGRFDGRGDSDFMDHFAGLLRAKLVALGAAAWEEGR